MTFVPPPHNSVASSRARDLADKLTRFIEEYRQENPSITQIEIRAALRMASVRSRRVSSRMGIAVALMVTVLAMVVFLLAGQQNGTLPPENQVLPLALIVVGIVVVVAALVVARAGGAEDGKTQMPILILAGAVLLVSLVGIYFLALRIP